MKRLFLPLLAAAFVVACAPRDIPIDGDRNGNQTGPLSNKVLVVENEGDISETCPGNPYSFIESPESSDPLIFNGTITATLTVGDRNCFKIGSIVELKNKGEGTVSRGNLKIKRVEIIPVTKINETHAKAMDMSVQEAIDFANSEIQKVKALPKGKGFNPRGMVSITFFEYVEAQAPPLAEVLVFDTVGMMAPTCPKDYTPSKNLDSPIEKDSSIFSGQLIGAMSAGDRNCFQIGSVVALKAKGVDSPERGKLKIAWVEIVPVSLLNKDHAAIMNMSLDELKTAAGAAIKAVKFDAKNIVNITVFEYVPPGT